MKRTHIVRFERIKTFFCALIIAITVSFFMDTSVAAKSQDGSNWKVRLGTERASGQAIEGVI